MVIKTKKQLDKSWKKMEDGKTTITVTKLSESLLAEFDEKFVEINAINYKDKVLSGRDETTVIRLKQFLSTAITRIEKAYGGCTKCYGKGFSSEYKGAQYACADFPGDKSGIVKGEEVGINYCDCSRGKDLQEMFTRAEEEAYTAMNQGATCCKDKHQTFYGAIIKSPQWQAWYKEQTKRFGELKLNKKTNKYEGEPTFDIDESVGIGAIGDRHLQEFFRFIEKEAREQVIGEITEILRNCPRTGDNRIDLVIGKEHFRIYKEIDNLTKERKDK